MALNVVSIHFPGNLLNKSHGNVYSINLWVCVSAVSRIVAAPSGSAVSVCTVQDANRLFHSSNTVSMQLKSFHSSDAHPRAF